MIATLTDTRTGDTYPVDPHQQEAYDHVMSRHRAALFLGMSLSKTVIMLSALYDLHYREAAIVRTLVIAPDKVARITWPDEIRRWRHLAGMRYSVVSGTAKQRAAALEAPAELYIIGVDNVSWLCDRYIRKTSGRYRGALPFDCVVIDESSLFKSRGSQRFRKLARAIRPVPYRYLLTGTPSPQGLIDLWSQLYLLDEGERLGRTFGEFADKYFSTWGNGQIVYEYRPHAWSPAAIAAKIQDIALTMRTRDYVELPPQHYVDEAVELAPAEREDYERLAREYVLALPDGDTVSASTAGDLTGKLLQITGGAIYEEQRYEEGRALPRTWRTLNGAKLAALRRILAEHPDENVICVYQFRHEAARIKEAIPEARELKTVDDFEAWNAGRVRLLLLHPASAGHGLNLQFGGRRMVWFTPTWNLEHVEQTEARLIRRGQTRDIYIHRLIVEGTCDRRCADRVRTKATNQEFLMREIRKLRQQYGVLR